MCARKFCSHKNCARYDRSRRINFLIVAAAVVGCELFWLQRLRNADGEAARRAQTAAIAAFSVRQACACGAAQLRAFARLRPARGARQQLQFGQRAASERVQSLWARRRRLSPLVAGLCATTSFVEMRASSLRRGKRATRPKRDSKRRRALRSRQNFQPMFSTSHKHDNEITSVVIADRLRTGLLSPSAFARNNKIM